ncbi:hypothetical protein NQZ68_012511 [Dissostichus eleginoides]|nr:hypothetical protein NQZ68_012511 [Dissostichus eleginoides]
MHHSLVITSQLRHFCLYQRLKALIDGQPWLRKGRDKQAQMGPYSVSLELSTVKISTSGGVHDWSLILLPANSVNTAQASSWPQLDSCLYPALFPPQGMGEGILPIHTNIKALLVVDGAGCELVEMDDHKLIARGWPVAKLLEYQWEDPLLTK